MRTLAVLPVKSFGAAKERLSGLLGSGSRQALAQAMLSDVLGSLRRVPSLEAVAVVTRDPVAEGAALGRGARVLRDEAEAGQSEAALIGIRQALVEGFERVLLVPGDAPLLDAGEVAALLERAAERGLEAVIVPDRHRTGTNALLLSPPDAIAPSFGPGSLERHLAAARRTALAHAVEEVPSLLLDVDTADDLAELARALEARRGQAQMTRGALRQLDRSRLGTPVPSGGREPAPARA